MHGHHYCGIVNSIFEVCSIDDKNLSIFTTMEVL